MSELNIGSIQSGKFSINGVTISADGSVIHITDLKGLLYVNGVLYGPVGGKAEATPQVVNVPTGQDSTFRGDVNGDLTINGENINVTIKGNVEGDIVALGNVTCGKVYGGVDTQGDVNCTRVGGSVDAAGNVTCGRVAGCIEAGGNITKKTGLFG